MVIYTSEDMVIEDMAEQPETIWENAFETHNMNLLEATIGDATIGEATIGEETIGEVTIGEETTVAHFCEFVDFYTRYARNPLCTVLTCEQQAETIRISDQDLCPETVHLLIDTMLSAIEHLEKKWLDEQIDWEDSEQRHRRDLAHVHTKTLERNQERKQESHGIGHVFSQSARWVWQFLGRGKPVPWADENSVFETVF